MAAIYHPPKPIHNVDALLSTIDATVQDLSSSMNLIILAGDLNAIVPCTITEQTGLADIVEAPTRGNSHLDHILVSDKLYSNIKVIKAIGKSDHSAIVAYNGPVLVNITKQRTKCTYRHRSPAKNALYLKSPGCFRL